MEHGAEAHKGESPFQLYELLLTDFTGGQLVWASAKVGSSKQQPSPIELNEEESEEELVTSKKGKGHQASRKVIGKTSVQRQRDQLLGSSTSSIPGCFRSTPTSRPWKSNTRR